MREEWWPFFLFLSPILLPYFLVLFLPQRFWFIFGLQKWKKHEKRGKRNTDLLSLSIFSLFFSVFQRLTECFCCTQFQEMVKKETRWKKWRGKRRKKKKMRWEKYFNCPSPIICVFFLEERHLFTLTLERRKSPSSFSSFALIFFILISFSPHLHPRFLFAF